MSKPILRKTCISKLPVEELRKHGANYIVTLSDREGELLIIPQDRFEKMVKDLRDDAESSLGGSSLDINRGVRNLMDYGKEYNIDEDGSTCYIYELTAFLGKPGDQLELCWDEGYWRIRNLVQEKKKA